MSNPRAGNPTAQLQLLQGRDPLPELTPAERQFATQALRLIKAGKLERLTAEWHRKHERLLLDAEPSHIRT